MFINKIPFLVSTIPRLEFTRIEYLSIKKEIALLTSINKIVSYYRSYSLHVGTMFVYPEFQSLKEKVVSTTLNTTGARGRVPEVERQIHVTKELIRAHHSNLPFPGFTRRMTIELSKHVAVFLKAFPPESVL